MRYPLFLDLAGQPVTVIGAGKVGVRKIRTLHQAGAVITVISPKAGDLPAGVRWIRRKYRRGDLAGARLVVAATDDLAVNAAVCREAQRRRQLVNCAAPPSAGNFIVPATLTRGGLTIAISTGGASPAAAKALRRDLERFVNAGYVRRLMKLSAQRKAP